MHFNVNCRNINENQFQSGKSNLDVFVGLTDKLIYKIPFFFDLLSEKEKARALRLKQKSDYNCYVSVHALLRIELSKLLKTDAGSIIFGEFKNGKPFIPGMDLSFSLSRSKNQFAFVIRRNDQFLGIDIEQIKTFIDFAAIAKNYFSTDEQELIGSYDNFEDQNRTFFEIWTRKEAFLKAIGVGITANLTTVNVIEGENNVEIECLTGKNTSIKILTFLINRSLISVASSVDFVPEFKYMS